MDNSLENVTDMIVSALEELKLDPNKKPIEREDLHKIVTNIGIQLSPFQLYEALFYARQSSQDPQKFRLDMLI